MRKTKWKVFGTNRSTTTTIGCFLKSQSTVSGAFTSIVGITIPASGPGSGFKSGRGRLSPP